MGVFKSSRIKDLELQNEDLRNKIHAISEREISLQQLNETLRKMRTEVAELNSQRLSLSNEINTLRIEESDKNRLLEELKTDVTNLRAMKSEEQNNILNYSEKIKHLEADISKKTKLITEIEGDLPPEPQIDLSEQHQQKNALLDEIQKLLAQLDSQRQELSNSDEKIKRLSIRERGIINSIEDKKHELDNLENHKILSAIDELRRIEEKVERLITDQKNIVDNIGKKQRELSSLNSRLEALNVKETGAQQKLNWLNQEIENSKSAIVSVTSKLQALKDVEEEAIIKARSLDATQDNLTSLSDEQIRLQKLENSTLSNLKALDLEIENKTTEISDLNKSLNELSQKEVDLSKSLESLKHSQEQVSELNNKLRSLREEESTQIDALDTMTTELLEKQEEKQKLVSIIEKLRIEEEEKKKRIAEFDKSYGHITDVQKLKDVLREEEAVYQQQISFLKTDVAEKTNEAAAIKIAVDELREIEAGLKSRVESYEQIKQEFASLTQEVISLKERGLAANNKLIEINSEYEKQKTQIDLSNATLSELREAEKAARGRVDQLVFDSKSKNDHLTDVERNILTKEEELSELENLLAHKLKEINDNNLKVQKSFEQIELKQNELVAIDESITIKTKRLTNLSSDVSEVELKQQALLQEVNRLESLRTDLHRSVILEQETIDKVKAESQQLRELVPLLEKRREEIEQSNSELEGRFAVMFQKFNAEMNELNEKRESVESSLKKSEVDLLSKEKLLFEKVRALEESERLLSLRQAEIESFEDLLSVIDEKREQFKNDLLKLDAQAIERKNYNNDLKVESEMILKKKVIIEQSLEEMLSGINSKYIETREKRFRIEKDIKGYEDRLFELNLKINESMNELVEIQSSISTIKIEHENHRGQVIKLSTMKKRLNEEVSKNRKLLQRYQKIREKLKIETSLGESKSDQNALNDATGEAGDFPEIEISKNSNIYKI